MTQWRYYFPGDGEDAARARCVGAAIVSDAEDAAQWACEHDYIARDGWERGDTEFEIVVISPDGDESRFTGAHEPSVEHRVYEAD